ncbi:hypothetical protein PENANT_c001G02296 [Penicillium antarcticum]|uniref:Thiol methyltransferase n=1 Tax=Penicillium antarcticum TaxID=416450 RepID=A0A1V6QQ75_9EURO|nr:uncharacterized protein N7508_010743 [Penicillium antarcticum]KAJ5295922.1 hypothetical protein N7508_010743 [Penicillium antarcticum]OQD91102.1 hypothetical protein PENANT_c001G02296 [Penicillium antarcticum]
MTAPTQAKDPKEMQEHLAQPQFKGDKYVEGWASLWDKGDNLPWDKGFPNPALDDTLVKHRGTIGGPLATDAQGQSYRRKALVPGCGRGVDVLLLASFGFDAYGLEYSESAIEACKKEEKENSNWYRVRDQTVGAGSVTWLQGDFFDDAWLQKAGVPLNGFDVVYDYTFFCALSPSMRPKWALRHTQLLAPSPLGNLICLEFPRHKDTQAAGPPYASPSEAYMAHLSHPGEDVPYDAKGAVKYNPLQPSSAGGLERVAYWQPERTHEMGQGENGVIHDRVSIWRRRN